MRRRRRRENNKIVEEGIKTLRRDRCVFDSFCLNGISCLILLLAIISHVFNQLILVKLFVL